MSDQSCNQDNTSMDEKDFEHIEKMMKLQFDSLKDALEIRNLEVNRRLDLLNGEADRLKLMQTTYVQREIWNQQNQDFVRQFGMITDVINDYRTFKAVLQSKASQSSVWIGYGFSAISIVIGFISVIISVAIGILTIIAKFYT
jgi:hypothetical protein